MNNMNNYNELIKNVYFSVRLSGINVFIYQLYKKKPWNLNAHVRIKKYMTKITIKNNKMSKI